MIAFMVVISIVAVVSLLVGLLAMLKASELEQALQKFKKQQGDETDALRQRVDSLSKNVAGKENPFAPAASKPPPASDKKTPSVSEKKPPSAPRPPPVASDPAAPLPPAAQPGQVVLDAPEKEVNFDCPHCGQNIDAPASMAGFHVNCPTCSGLITIPESSTSARPPAPHPASAETQPAAEDEEEVLKGATVRIDVGKMFDELDQKPKRQIVIKRRR
jgi:predicted RNA-binding Zn-ribbon protein involved in translation (DUF1610 family)